MCYRFDLSVVREAARGHWAAIFQALAPSLEAALRRPGKHVPCPVHGGKDGFRLFPNFQENGSCVCNTCGVRRDGFATLSWLNGWSFREALESVGRFLMLEPQSSVKVVSREIKAKYWQGEIFFIGPSPADPKKFFLLINDELKKRLCTFQERSLELACADKNLHNGDRVSICLQCDELLESSNGVRYRRQIWLVSKLESKESEQRRLLFESEKNEKLRLAIADAWRKSWYCNRKDRRQKPLLEYLKSRGLAEVEPKFLADIHFARHAVYDEASDSLWWRPLMAAAVRDIKGKLVDVHCTYLTEDGRKTQTGVPKQLMKLPSDATISGCAIRLGRPRKVLALAEGIETALSVCLGTGLPCWACVCAHGLASVEIPVGVQEVLIFEDKDCSGTGQKAARKLRKRLQQSGTSARIVSIREEIPAGAKGIDVNDILCWYGKEAVAEMLCD